MPNFRPSRPDDLPQLKELWALAFGDGEDYIQNFFDRYYQPHRMLVLEEAGAVRSMTAWFETSLALPDGCTFPAAYLYAVATRPDARGQGCAGVLLSGADAFFPSQGIACVTTVPATPSLHNFFAQNGFRECFTHSQHTFTPDPKAPPAPLPPLRPLSPEGYAAAREALLAHRPHIALPPQAVAYQAGACALSGGGLYAADTPFGQALLCAEGMEDGSLLLKELLGAPESLSALLPALPDLLPRWSGLYRTPGEDIPFGMLKWLSPQQAEGWDWNSRAYLGLAFD